MLQKHFSKQNNTKTPTQNRGTTTSQGNIIPSKDQTTNVSIFDGSDHIAPIAHNQIEQQSNVEGKRVPVHDRMRFPVAYDDDLLEAEDPKV